MLTVLNCIAFEHDLRSLCWRPSSARWHPLPPSACCIMCADPPARCAWLGCRCGTRPAAGFGRRTSSRCWRSRRNSERLRHRADYLSLVVAIVLTGVGPGSRRSSSGAARLLGGASSAPVSRPCTTPAWRVRNRGADRLGSDSGGASVALGAPLRCNCTAGRTARRCSKMEDHRLAASDRGDLQPPFHRDGRGRSYP